MMKNGKMKCGKKGCDRDAVDSVSDIDETEGPVDIFLCDIHLREWREAG